MNGDNNRNIRETVEQASDPLKNNAILNTVLQEVGSPVSAPDESGYGDIYKEGSYQVVTPQSKNIKPNQANTPGNLGQRGFWRLAIGVLAALTTVGGVVYGVIKGKDADRAERDKMEAVAISKKQAVALATANNQIKNLESSKKNSEKAKETLNTILANDVDKLGLLSGTSALVYPRDFDANVHKVDDEINTLLHPTNRGPVIEKQPSVNGKPLTIKGLPDLGKDKVTIPHHATTGSATNNKKRLHHPDNYAGHHPNNPRKLPAPATYAPRFGKAVRQQNEPAAVADPSLGYPSQALTKNNTQPYISQQPPVIPKTTTPNVVQPQLKPAMVDASKPVTIATTPLSAAELLKQIPETTLNAAGCQKPPFVLRDPNGDLFAVCQTVKGGPELPLLLKSSDMTKADTEAYKQVKVRTEKFSTICPKDIAEAEAKDIAKANNSSFKGEYCFSETKNEVFHYPNNKPKNLLSILTPKIPFVKRGHEGSNQAVLVLDSTGVTQNRSAKEFWVFKLNPYATAPQNKL